MGSFTKVERALGTRGIGVLLLGIGLVLAILGYAMSLLTSQYGPYFFKWADVIESGIAIFGITVALYLAGIPIAVNLVRAHEKIKTRIFEKSIDTATFSIYEAGLVAMILNVSLFAILYLLPIRELFISLVPPLETIQTYIPTTYLQLMQINSVIFLSAVAPGPSILFAIRRFREKGSSRGHGLIEFFQVLSYATVILVVISWYNRGTSSDTAYAFEVFQNILITFVLPGSIGGAGVLIFQQTIGRKMPYIG